MATTYSTQMTNERATPQVMNAQGSYKYRIPWDYTVAGAPVAENDIVQVCKLPAGCKVILAESVLHISATTGASTTIDIGHAAYKDKNGATIAADADDIVNGYDSTTITAQTLIPSTQAPVGTAADVTGVVDYSDAVEDVIVTLTALGSGFDGDIADVWTGYFTVEVAPN